jgi:uncharacterized membrane protein
VKRVLLVVLGAFFMLAGVTHFTAPDFYVDIVPPYLPAPRALVHVSGVCEIALGFLVLVPATRALAAWGLVALLLAVFPANINQAVHQVPFRHAPGWMPPPTPLGLWLRLPVQFVLIAWALWYARDPRVDRRRG